MIRATRGGEIGGMYKTSPEMDALTTMRITDIQGQASRRDIARLRQQLLDIMNGSGDEVPRNALTKEARIINQADWVMIRFDEANGRTNWTPAPIKYTDQVSDDVAEMFCRGMPLLTPEVTHANLNELLGHLSQLFDLKCKASFVQVLSPAFSPLNRALKHVSPDSVDYEKFERCINTAQYLFSKIAASPADQVGGILTEAHMLGIDPSEVDKFVIQQRAGESVVRNPDMGNLPEVIDNNAPSKGWGGYYMSNTICWKVPMGSWGLI
jgi:hypothetical protein